MGVRPANCYGKCGELMTHVFGGERTLSSCAHVGFGHLSFGTACGRSYHRSLQPEQVYLDCEQLTMRTNVFADMSANLRICDRLDAVQRVR